MAASTQTVKSQASTENNKRNIYISDDEESQKCLQELKDNYTFKKAFRTWRNNALFSDLEFNALSSVSNVFNLNNPEIEVNILDTEIDYQTEEQSKLCDKKKEVNKIHELSILNKENYDLETQKEIVLVHGYGASLGLFFNNFETFANLKNTSFHALDLLGFGLSSRPNFPKRKNPEKYVFNHTAKKNVKDKDGNEIEEIVNQEISVKTSLGDVEIAENFFIDSLEAWRRAKKIERFTLIGHSLGGYLSCCYALKYPERVEKLVLLSPVGLETSAFDLTEFKDGSNTATSKDTTFVPGPNIEEEFEPLHENMKKLKRNGFLASDQNGHVQTLPNLPTVFKFIWRQEISPFTLIRKAGMLGPSLMSGWTFSRFMDLKDTEKIMKMHEYCYASFTGKGSGEHCLPRILGPGVLAYHPLLKRVPENLKCDSLWVYGDSDWMNSSAGATMCNKINSIGKHKADFEIISSAGHHLYLDNAKEFNKMITDYLLKE